MQVFVKRCSNDNAFPGKDFLGSQGENAAGRTICPDVVRSSNRIQIRFSDVATLPVQNRTDLLTLFTADTLCRLHNRMLKALGIRCKKDGIFWAGIGTAAAAGTGFSRQLRQRCCCNPGLSLHGCRFFFRQFQILFPERKLHQFLSVFCIVPNSGIIQLIQLMIQCL